MIRRIFFFIVFPALVYSQENLIDDQLIYFQNGVISKDSLWVISNTDLWSYPLDNSSNPIKRPLYNELLDYYTTAIDQLKNYQAISINDEIYFVENKGGMVFKMKNDSIKRVDRSFTHRMQIGANLMEYKNTLYRFGGYGFWSFRNFFTYFVEDLGEWEAESPKNSNEIPEGSSNNLFAQKEDEVMFFRGKTIDPYDLSNPNVFSDDVWHYDFSKLKWHFKGPMMIDLSTARAHKSLGDEILLLDTSNKLIQILPFENKVRYYTMTSLQYKLYIVNNDLAVFKKDDAYYAFIKYDNVNKVELVKRNEDEFFGQLIEETKLYQDLSPWRYMLLLLALPMLYYIRKFALLSKERNSKIIINGEGLIYHKVFFEFEPKELEVINLLLDFDIVHSSDILALVENPNHNYSHNMRTKNQLIDKINYKFKTMLKIDYDLITSEKSAEDKRIIDYKIDKEYFN